MDTLVQMWRLTIVPAHTKRVWKCLDYVWGGQGRPFRQGWSWGREIPKKEDKASSTEIFLWLGAGPEWEFLHRHWLAQCESLALTKRGNTQAFLSAVGTRGRAGVRLKSCQQSEFNSWSQTPHSFAVTTISPLVWDSSPASAWYKVWLIFLSFPSQCPHAPQQVLPPSGLLPKFNSGLILLPRTTPVWILPYLHS